ncbi:hypothetical protein DPMN_064325 [Dreissena polymorpha]|uniref:Uncharacterized protein n=1 Tax=Dreissena polymorpha TaxID=45954 RepID=A0A9D4CD03_DREPO|nr:hypothetical protein DPMN_064325 [Dreissena polymorpha]
MRAGWLAGWRNKLFWGKRVGSPEGGKFARKRGKGGNFYAKFNISGLFSEFSNYSGDLFTKSLRVQTKSDQGLVCSFPKPVSLWRAKQICEVTSFQTLVRSCLCTRLAETKKTVVCHLKVLVVCLHSVAVTEDLRGDQFPDIGSLLLVYAIGRD